MTNERPKLVILDGTAMLFRSFFGMGDFYAKDRITQVGGVIGTGQIIQKALRTLNPKHIIVVFDVASITFRNEIDPDYKANRGEPPEELIPQFALTRQLVEVLGFRNFGVLGYEADDLMGTLSKMAQEAGMDCCMVNVDKDLYQLITDDSPSIELYDLKKDIVYDEAGVKEKIGVPPNRVVDYLALVGDSSDNISGVKGVGPKTALALLKAFDNLDNLYDNLEKIASLTIRGSKSLGAKLEANKEAAYLSRRLVTLDREVPIDITAENLAEQSLWQGPKQEAQEFFETLGFERILRNIQAFSSGKNKPSPQDLQPTIEEVNDLPW